MPRTDKSLVLPPSETIQSMQDVRDWMRKASGLIELNQSDVYDDLSNVVDKTSSETVNGTKTFSSLKISGNMDCNQKQMVSMVIENRTDDPSSPVEGQIWLRTDLL